MNWYNQRNWIHPDVSSLNFIQKNPDGSDITPILTNQLFFTGRHLI